jgi:hypothetical protein
MEIATKPKLLVNLLIVNSVKQANYFNMKTFVMEFGIFLIITIKEVTSKHSFTLEFIN